MDTKAVRILRSTLLLIGLVLTALSISGQSPSFDISRFVNYYTLSGMLSLILAVTVAATSYIVSSYEAGIGHGDLQSTRRERYTDIQLHENLASGYADWIQYNQNVVKYNPTLVTVTLILLIGAMGLLTVGILVGDIRSIIHLDLDTTVPPIGPRIGNFGHRDLHFGTGDRVVFRYPIAGEVNIISRISGKNKSPVPCYIQCNHRI